MPSTICLITSPFPIIFPPISLLHKAICYSNLPVHTRTLYFIFNLPLLHLFYHSSFHTRSFRLSCKGSPRFIALISNTSSGQVVWPEDDGNACLVVVEARGTDVVVLCERQAGVFTEHQRLNLTKPMKVRTRCAVNSQIMARR